MISGIYKQDGTCRHLQGKRALLKEAEDPKYWLAQFDDLSIKEAYNWWLFDKESFDVEENKEE